MPWKMTSDTGRSEPLTRPVTLHQAKAREGCHVVYQPEPRLVHDVAEQGVSRAGVAIDVLYKKPPPSLAH